MKTVLALCILLTPCYATGGQESPLECPRLEVVGPRGMMVPKEPATFVLQMDHDLPERYSYRWNVENGSVTNGQGTRVVEVTTTEYGTNLRAIVTVSGLPKGCPNTVSEIVGVVQKLEGQPVDTYGDLPSNDQRGRLDLFFSELANYPTNKGLVVVSPSKKNDRRDIMRRVRFVVSHARFRKFDLSRLIFATEFQGIRQTVLWRVPPGADLPCPDATCQQLNLSH